MCKIKKEKKNSNTQLVTEINHSTYERGLGEVAEDGSHRVEGVKLALLIYTQKERSQLTIASKKCRGYFICSENNETVIYTSPSALNWMRVLSSARRTKSRMMGAAKSESSHVLWSTMVFVPPMNISEVYSSIALLLSPTYGTYYNTRTT